MSRQTLTAIALVSLLALAASGAARATGAQTWILDPVHTQIVFFADHLGFSHAIGRLKVKQGWFTFDADDWSTARADVVVDMTSLDTGNAPTARFRGNALERKTADSGILHGELWLRGVHHDVDLAVTFNRQGTDPYAFKNKAGFTATATLDRFDFGMSSYRDVVAGPVELRIEVEGIRSKHKEIETDGDEKQ